MTKKAPKEQKHKYVIDDNHVTVVNHVIYGSQATVVVNQVIVKNQVISDNCGAVVNHVINDYQIVV